MNVAVTVWGSRISPVVDAARTLLVAEIQDKCVTGQYTLPLQSGRVDQLVRILHEHDVSTLLCGALCERSVSTFIDGNIELIPFLSGEALSAIELWSKGGDLSVLLMPGCRRAQLWQHRQEPVGQTKIPDLRGRIRYRRGKRDNQDMEVRKCQVSIKMDLSDKDL